MRKRRILAAFLCAVMLLSSLYAPTALATELEEQPQTPDPTAPVLNTSEYSFISEAGIAYRILEGNQNQVEVAPYNWIQGPGHPNATSFVRSEYDGKALTIPETVVNDSTTYNVVGIRRGAFQSVTPQSLDLGNTITYIGDGAFGYFGYTELTIPASVETMGSGVFSGSNLTSITFAEGSNLKRLDGTFDLCEKLTSVTLPDSVEYIGGGTFAHCSALQNVTIPASAVIASNVFSDWYDETKNITFASESPYSLQDGILWGPEGMVASYKENLGNINIPDTMTSIGEKLFWKDHTLTSVTLPNTLTEIGKLAFAGTGLTSIDIPDSVISIGQEAFTGCQSLTSVALSNSLTSIPERAFSGTGLTSIVLPNSVTSIENYAFLNCANLADVTLPEGLLSIGTQAFRKSCINSITIPASVTQIGKAAFNGCSSLQTVTMQGGTPPTIGAKAFDAGTKFIVPYGSSEKYAAALGTDAANITEMEAPVVPVTSVTVAPAELNLTVGNTGALTATVGPDTATNKAVTWASSDEAVATVTVDEDGVVTVTAKGEGTATITATAQDGSNVSDSCAVTVSAVTVPATGVTVNPAELTLSIGGTGALTANVSPEGATDTVAWSSSNPAVATVENGVVTAAGVGTATITATAGTVSAACAVTVQPDAIPVTGVTVTADRTSLYNGEVAVLTAAVLPENATDKTVTWTSSDETVATVDASGRVTAVSAGSVTITAAAGGVTSEAVFIVVQGPAPVLVGSVNVNPAALNLTEGDARALTATVGPENATNRAVVWTSSNPSVAAVDGNGVVTALRAGSAVITATAIDGGGASGSCTVAVSAYVDPFASYFPDYFDYPSNSGTTAPAQPAEPAEPAQPETPVIPDEPTPTDPGTEIKDEEIPLSEIPLLFTDVKADDWHIEAVAFVLSKGIMSGASETKFEPETNIDRGMIVTMLHRLEGTPEAAPSAFTDVKDEQYCAEAIGWASQNGVVQGYSDTEFRPSREISREQLASILYRYAQLKGYDTSEQADLSAYSDASNVSGYAKDAMGWAVAKGLISGVTESTLVPGGSATRAQAAMILMRFCENVVPA